MNRFMCNHHMGHLPRTHRSIDMTENITLLQVRWRVVIKCLSVIYLISLIVKGRRPPKARSDRKIKCNPIRFLLSTECMKI